MRRVSEELLSCPFFSASLNMPLSRPRQRGWKQGSASSQISTTSMWCVGQRTLQTRTPFRSKSCAPTHEASSKARPKCVTCAVLQDAALLVNSSSKGLPVSQQGVVILGTPVGQPAFVLQQLTQKSAAHAPLLEQISRSGGFCKLRASLQCSCQDKDPLAHCEPGAHARMCCCT